MRFKKNDFLTVTVEDITNLGFGVAKHSGEVIFISDTVPGDVAEIKIIKVTSSYSIARCERLIKSSPERTGERCPIAQCKSCAYKLLDYSREAELKEESVRQIFKKAGLPEVNIAPIFKSPATKCYRNKAQYPVSQNKDGEFIIGFFAPKSHRVTEAAGCPLAPSVFSEIIEVLRAFFKEKGYSAYDETSGMGLLRHIYLRRGEVSGEVLLTLVINGDTLPCSSELVERIIGKFPDVVGILLNKNKKNTNVILSDEYETLFGRDYIFDTLAGVKLKITAPAFYQVNHDAAELLYAKAHELAAPTESDTLLDLYCGAGSIGLSMARNAGEVIGIEIVESAVECARFNAASNGINNASFYTGDAKNTEHLLERAEKFRGEKIRADIVILDPPRAGCDEALISYVSSLNTKRIIYISCNPQTLARDMKLFSEFGYVGSTVTPVDMFPATGHVECVVCLGKQH